MKNVVRQTGSTRWQKTERGWKAQFDTPFGMRWVHTGTADKPTAVRIVKQAKKELSLSLKFTSRLGHLMQYKTRPPRNDTAIMKWVESVHASGSLDRHTIVKYATDIRAFLRHNELLTATTAEITEAHVASWVNRKDGCSAGNRRRRLAVLKTYCDWLQDSDFIRGNPARVVRKINMNGLTHAQKEPKKKVPFTDDEIARLLVAIEEATAQEEARLGTVDEQRLSRCYNVRQRIADLKFWRIAILISRWCGLRIGDICQLEWDCIASPDVMVVWTDKRDRRVEVPVQPMLGIALAAWPHDDERYMFKRQRDLYHGGCASLLSWQFGKFLKRLKIANRSFHCLRGTFLNDAVERFMAAGKTREQAVRLAADLAGHSNVSTTIKHYIA